MVTNSPCSPTIEAMVTNSPCSRCAEAGGSSSSSSGSSASSTSAAALTPAFPYPLAPAPPKPPVVIRSAAATLEQRGRAPLTLGCAAAVTCKGELTLERAYVTRTRRKRRGKTRVILTRRTLVIGRAWFSIPPGRSLRVWVALDKAAIRAIAAARGHRLGVLALASVGGAPQLRALARRTVVLGSYAPPRSRDRRR